MSCCLRSFYVLWVVLVFLGYFVGVNAVLPFCVLFSVVSGCFRNSFQLLLLFRLSWVAFGCLRLLGLALSVLVDVDRCDDTSFSSLEMIGTRGLHMRTFSRSASTPLLSSLQ